MKKRSARANAARNRRGTNSTNNSSHARNGSGHAHNGRTQASRSHTNRNPISQSWFNDFLSEMLAVEEGGEKLYQKALDELQHDELRDKLEEFLEETQRHVELVQELMEAAGVEEGHKSPGAEAAEQKAQGLLSVEVEEELRDLNNIENLVLAETKDHWDWEMLNSLVGRIQERELKDAVRSAVSEVFKQEREHVQWNQETLTNLAMEMATRDEAGEEASDLEPESPKGD